MTIKYHPRGISICTELDSFILCEYFNFLSFSPIAEQFLRKILFWSVLCFSEAGTYTRAIFEMCSKWHQNYIKNTHTFHSICLLLFCIWLSDAHIYFILYFLFLLPGTRFTPRVFFLFLMILFKCNIAMGFHVYQSY